MSTWISKRAQNNGPISEDRDHRQYRVHYFGHIGGPGTVIDPSQQPLNPRPRVSSSKTMGPGAFFPRMRRSFLRRQEQLAVFFVGVLIMRALGFGVYTRAADSWKLPVRFDERKLPSAPMLKSEAVGSSFNDIAAQLHCGFLRIVFLTSSLVSLALDVTLLQTNMGVERGLW